MRYISGLIVLAVFGAGTAMAQSDAAFNAYVDAGFAAMDINNDGKVERSEFNTFMRGRLERQAAEFDAAFAKMDSNSNGTLDKAEAMAGNPLLSENFALIDSNKNGALSKDELRAAMIAAQSQEVAG